jgi:hypothetical protein
MSLRILHVIGSVNPAAGGPIEGVRQLSKVNSGYGHTIEVLTLEDPSSPWLGKLGFPVHAMGPSITHTPIARASCRGCALTTVITTW